MCVSHYFDNKFSNVNVLNQKKNGFLFIYPVISILNTSVFLFFFLFFTPILQLCILFFITTDTCLLDQIQILKKQGELLLFWYKDIVFHLIFILFLLLGAFRCRFLTSYFFVIDETKLSSLLLLKLFPSLTDSNFLWVLRMFKNFIYLWISFFKLFNFFIGLLFILLLLDNMSPCGFSFLFFFLHIKISGLKILDRRR